MARPSVSHNIPSPTMPNFHSRKYMYAILNALVVLLIYIGFWRENSGIPFETYTQHVFPVADQGPPTALVGDTSGVSVSPPASGGLTAISGGVAGSEIGSNSGDFFASNGPSQQQQKTRPSPSNDQPKAVIIESSMIPNLIPIILHFATVLGPAWGVILFTLKDSWVEPMSAPFKRLVDEGQIEVRFLPAETLLSNSQSVSRFLTSPWVWEQLASARRVLLFQTDSILCSRSEAQVDDYFKYDLVGAPIAEQYGQGFNGGLSLRNPMMFLNITKNVNFAASGQEFEDQYFYTELKKAGAKLPTVEAAMTFAVETIYYETPLGYHQPQRWQAAKLPNIEEWCPEVKMLIGRRAQ